MATEIKCPNCNHTFPMEEAMTEEYKKDLREKMLTFTKQKEEEYLRKLEEIEKREQQQQLIFDRKLVDERKNIQNNLEQTLRKTIAADYENQVKLLENNKKETEEKLMAFRQQELQYLQKEQNLKNREDELELVMQKTLQAQREQISEEIRRQENEKNLLKESEHQMQIRELKLQLDAQKKLAEEMKRKADQGSIQIQGEAQELVLEDLLRNSFPFDLISEVGKGVRGADCIQIVRNQFGQECGKIIYESKRTKDFGGDWIEKLKKDMRGIGVDVAVLVTKCYPKEMDCFGEKDGVWICSFDEVKAVAYILRDSIIKLYASTISQENKGEKMQLLYNYLIGSEFSEQWKAIREGFMSMRISIQRERDAMEKLWKAREKQLEKVLLNAAHIKGSIEGIAGSDTINLTLTDEDDYLLVE